MMHELLGFYIACRRCYLCMQLQYLARRHKIFQGYVVYFIPTITTDISPFFLNVVLKKGRGKIKLSAGFLLDPTGEFATGGTGRYACANGELSAS